MGKNSRKRRERIEQVQKAREIEGLVKRTLLRDRILLRDPDAFTIARIGYSLEWTEGHLRMLIERHPDFKQPSGSYKNPKTGKTLRSLDVPIHVLLEFLTGQKTDPPNISGSVKNEHYESIVIDSAIRSCPKEYLDAFDVSMSSSILDRFDAKRLRVQPPFEHTWLEFNTTSYINGLNPSNSLNVGVSIVVEDPDEEGCWLHCNFNIEHQDGEIDEADVDLRLDKDGHFVSTRSDVSAFLALFSVFVLHALALLNCRNIETIENVPSAADNAAYQRHFGVPMTKYKTLAIKLMSKRYERDDQPQQQFDVMPLHIRRGNFAHYTDDAPLFGKYTGTFWRPATAVGNAKNGIRVKDYEVKSG